MLFESREVNQVAMQFEGGYLVADRFSRIRRRFLDGLSQLLEQGLDFWRETGDVRVNAFGVRSASFSWFSAPLLSPYSL
ncbi:MAG: hypothetical protein ABIO88_15650 [Burkholderiaceae bacterium]